MERSLRWRVENSYSRLKLVERDWNRIHAQDRHATPFQSFCWIYNWYFAYRNIVESPWCLLCYSGEDLVGIAPMYMFRRGIFGLGLRSLAFVGTSEPEACEACAEYMDLLCVEGYKQACSLCLAEAVQSEKGLWSVELVRLLPERSSSLRAVLHDVFPCAQQWTAGYRFLVDLDARKETLGLSRKLLSGLRRKRRKFLALKDARVRWAVGLEDCAELYAALIDVHTKRWERSGEAGVFGNTLFARFHEQLLSELLPSGRLMLFLLEAEGRPLAAHYCLLGTRGAYFYQSGVDLSVHPELSLGSVAHLIALEYCQQQGLAYYDLMAGAREGYKRRFARPDDAPLMTVFLYRNRLSAALVRGLRYLEAGGMLIGRHSPQGSA